jgi:hypothetical protein
LARNAVPLAGVRPPGAAIDAIPPQGTRVPCARVSADPRVGRRPRPQRRCAARRSVGAASPDAPSAPRGLAEDKLLRGEGGPHAIPRDGPFLGALFESLATPGGAHAHRRPDGVAVVPLALLGP